VFRGPGNGAGGRRRIYLIIGRCNFPSFDKVSLFNVWAANEKQLNAVSTAAAVHLILYKDTGYAEILFSNVVA
jgi:hypothetical protein